MKKGFILSFGTLSILNETDDDDASQSRQTGPKVSFSAGKTKFKQCSFPDRRTTFSLRRSLSCYSLVTGIQRPL